MKDFYRQAVIWDSYWNSRRSGEKHICPRLLRRSIVLNITVRQLEAFIAVAQLEGFTRAAERVHLTQSAVSILIRELERQLRIQLFDRSTRKVQLTEAGKEFLPFAEM